MTGVDYVRSQRRQIAVQPNTKTEAGASHTKPPTADECNSARQTGEEVSNGCGAEAGGGVNTPPMGLPHSVPLSGKLKDKRVLLVDSSATMRERRAESMRKLGMEVDCAADISEARSWWREHLYRLVLIDMESGPRYRFCDDMRRATPPQQISFLVGKPAYLAAAPRPDIPPVQTSEVQATREQVPWRDEVRAALAVELAGGVSQRWGILEASWRISAVRALWQARSTATHGKSAPPRDVETRKFKRAAAESRTLDDLLREELQ
jgi:CheY-like chemotaxis protein